MLILFVDCTYSGDLSYLNEDINITKVKLEKLNKWIYKPK